MRERECERERKKADLLAGGGDEVEVAVAGLDVGLALGPHAAQQQRSAQGAHKQRRAHHRDTLKEGGEKRKDRGKRERESV